MNKKIEKKKLFFVVKVHKCCKVRDHTTLDVTKVARSMVTQDVKSKVIKDTRSLKI